MDLRASQNRPLKNRALAVCFYPDRSRRAPPKYLLVRHRPTQEWGLLSGTCARGEKPVNCAMRELREETKDAVLISFSPYNTRSTVIVWPEGAVRYHVFFIDLSNYRSPSAIRAAFHASKRTGKEYEEVDMLTFETLDELRGRKKVWEVTRFLIQHPSFQRMHRELCDAVVVAPLDVKPQTRTNRRAVSPKK